MRVSIRARPEGRAIRSEMIAEQHTWDVSIRARPEGRAIPVNIAHYKTEFLVSIRARPEGRAIHVYKGMYDDDVYVSIRARPEGRAIRHGNFAVALVVLFQSAPVPKDGRYIRLFMLLLLLVGFNPRPSRRTGDTRFEAQLCRSPDVSIRARPEGRAIPFLQPGCRFRPYRFNPRPSRRTGDTQDRVTLYVPEAVSIRARPEGRAILDTSNMRDRQIMFQSAPVPKAGRYVC